MPKRKFDIGHRVKVKCGEDRGKVGWVRDRDWVGYARRIVYCIYDDNEQFIAWLYSYELDPYPIKMVELEDML
jgi:hypothetical protein